MINWLKFLPFHFRDETSDEWRSPSASRGRQIQLTAGGSKIRIIAPRHSSRLPQEQLYAKRFDGRNSRFDRYHSHTAANDNWVYNTLLFRSWSYWTAWFTGSAGELRMHGSVIKRNDDRNFDGPSFFHPATFTYVLANYLDTIYGHQEQKGQAKNQGPLDWTTHHHLPVFSASFRISGLRNELTFVFPVDSKAFFRLSFKFSGHAPGLREDQLLVAKQIISTVNLELSPEAQAQLDAVKAECPDMSLPEEFAPLKWPIKPEDIGKGEILKPTNPDDEFFSIY